MSATARRLASFNDDIQGTAAVGLAAVLAAGRATKTPLTEQRVVIMGAGAAGIGIAQLLADALRRAGVAAGDVLRRIAVLDSRGLSSASIRRATRTSRRSRGTPISAQSYGLDASRAITLREVIVAMKPTVLIGTTGEPGVFDETVVRTMAEHVRRPAIFPLSNPTANSEATVADIVRWTDGRALIATGSPFDAVLHNGQRIEASQANNVYIFPGIGLGALVAEAREVSDAMFSVAAETVAGMITDEDVACGALLPQRTRLREVARAVAHAVALEAASSGHGKPMSADEVDKALDRWMWDPAYPRVIAE